MNVPAGGPLGFAEDPDDPPPARSQRPRSPRAPEPGGGPRGTFRTRLPGVLLLLAGVVLLAAVGYNTLRTEGGSSSGPAVGRQAPPFAAPLALGSVEGDVNVARRNGQGAAGDRPACSVRGSGILNSCDLVSTGPVALAFFVAGTTRCTDEVDALARAGARHPDVRVAAVAVRSDRGDVRDLVRRRGWRFPVAYDRDGGLANLYGVAVCPQVTYILPGGVVQGSTVGTLDEAGLDRRLAQLRPTAR